MCQETEDLIKLVGEFHVSIIFLSKVSGSSYALLGLLVTAHFELVLFTVTEQIKLQEPQSVDQSIFPQ